MNRTPGTFSIRQLQLVNALITDVPIAEAKEITDSAKLKVILEKMNAVLQKHGAQPVGSLAMRTSIKKNASEQEQFTVSYIQESNVFIPNMESPYTMKKRLCTIMDCVHVRFSGKQKELVYLLNKTISMIGHDNLASSKEIYFLNPSQDDDSGNITVEIYIPIIT